MMQEWLVLLWPENRIGWVVFALYGVMVSVWLYVVISRYWFYRRLSGALMQYATLEALEVALTNQLVLLDVIVMNAVWLGLAGSILSVMWYFGLPLDSVDATKLMRVFTDALKTTFAGLLLALCVDTSQRFIKRSVSVLMLRWQEMRRLQRGEY